MELSAANLLLAAQQAGRAPQPHPAQSHPAQPFASTLAAEARKDALFAPLDFKQAAPAAPQTQADRPQRPGAHLDIRV